MDRKQQAEMSKAKLKLANSEEVLKIESKELKEDEEQLTKTEIVAPHPGTVAYANHRYM